MFVGSGTTKMPLWCADSLVTMPLVCIAQNTISYACSSSWHTIINVIDEVILRKTSVCLVIIASHSNKVFLCVYLL